MTKILRGALLFAGLVLAGCQSEKNHFDPPKPLDQMNHEELCSYYGFYLTNPALQPQTRAIATAKMREKGCTK